jgi:hypothetical protein
VSRQNTAWRHLGGDGHETFEFRPLRIWQAVQPASDSVQNASGGQARQDDPGRIDGVQIAGAQQPLLVGQIKDALGVGVGEHGESMFRLFVQCNISTKKRNILMQSCLVPLLGSRTADHRSPNQRGSARGHSLFPRTSA